MTVFIFYKQAFQIDIPPVLFFLEKLMKNISFIVFWIF